MCCCVKEHTEVETSRSFRLASFPGLSSFDSYPDRSECALSGLFEIKLLRYSLGTRLVSQTRETVLSLDFRLQARFLLSVNSSVSSKYLFQQFGENHWLSFNNK